ncbi:MAG: alpha-ketoacid dehydrogenase subunit beta [Prevotella sp.]|nr:alpha-ketoacid dehydrogenase subunit beta [Prevotella sp.]
MARKLSYGEAINDAHRLALINDDKCFVIGQGVNNPWFVGKTTTGLMDEFGPRRIMDSPVSEAAMTGACIGAAMAGMHPIVFHPRMDFMYLALDQIINHCASWNYMFAGKVNVPVVIRGIVNRGGEQGPQHSQSPFGIYANIPGLKVVTPATPYDAKGLLLAAIADPNPVIFIDDRWLYDQVDDVPEDYYEVPIGKANVLKEGNDITVVAASFMVKEAMEAAQKLEEEGVSVEVIDIRSLKPLDTETIIKSVKKTRRALVTIEEWNFASVASQVAKEIYDGAFTYLTQPVKTLTLPDVPAPASKSLEAVYYKKSSDVYNIVKDMLANKD